MRICNRCVMDTTDSKIVFDEEGVCDHCRNYDSKILPVWKKGLGHESELKELLAKIKKDGQGKDFDCIIGMSGGVDSSYLVHLAKAEFDLRPLVFHVDAGWNSQVAVNNIERLIDGLGLELYTEVINWEEMKDLQLAYFKASIPNIDMPQDVAFFSTMYKFASKHKVKNILTGANQSTECIRNPVEWIYYGDAVQLRDVHRRFGSVQLKTYPVSNILWHKVYLPVKGIKVHRPLNLVPYHKNEAIELLAETYPISARYPIVGVERLAMRINHRRVHGQTTDVQRAVERETESRRALATRVGCQREVTVVRRGGGHVRHGGIERIGEREVLIAICNAIPVAIALNRRRSQDQFLDIG